MDRRLRACGNDKPTAPGAGECGDGALHLSSFPHVDRAHFKAERWRDGLDDGVLADGEGQRRIANNPDPRCTRHNLLEEFRPFATQVVFEDINPVALPPGRASVSISPEPTGSGTFAKTIGSVRVTRSNCAVVVPPVARRTSGSRATSSDAYARPRSASFAPHR